MTITIPDSIREEIKKLFLQGFQERSHADPDNSFLTSLIDDVDDYVEIVLDDVVFSYERFFDEDSDTETP